MTMTPHSEESVQPKSAGMMAEAILSIFLFLASSLSSAAAQNLVCGQDLNGDGATTGSAESGQCMNTPEGPLCPVGAVGCTATYRQPICPPGGGINGNSDRCEAPIQQVWRPWLFMELVGQSGLWAFRLQIDLTDDGLYDLTVTNPGGPQMIRSFEENGLAIASSTVARTTYWSLTTGGAWSSSSDFSGGNWWSASQSGPQANRQAAAGYLKEHVRLTYGIAPAAVRLQPGSEWFGEGFCFNLQDDRCYSAQWERPYDGCPSGYLLDSAAGVCQAPPQCAVGTYDSNRNECYEGDSTCPLGGEYSCMNNNGAYQCSSNRCIDLTANPPQTVTPDMTAYQNDGQVDPSSGMCLGPLYIFNGTPGECRPAGAGTSFFDCCDNAREDFLIFREYCTENEWRTNTLRDAESCHFIGDYCKTRWPLVGCVQRANVYCCFNSKLARVIQEQGRGQLTNFAPDGQWGSTAAPNCIGLTPEELQYIDFSQVALPLDGVVPRGDIAVQQEIGNKIDAFYRNLQP